MKLFRYRRPFLKTLLGFSVLLLFVLTICAVLPGVARRFPFEALIGVAVSAICVIAIVLYVWELVIIGWVVDFLSEIGVPRISSKTGSS